MAKLPNFLVIIRSEKLSGKGQGRGVGVRKKERFVLGKRTFRSQKSKHFVLRIIVRFKPFSKEENLVFINAWNEWAEGNHLEPDQKWGRRYLEVTKEAILETSKE